MIQYTASITLNPILPFAAKTIIITTQFDQSPIEILKLASSLIEIGPLF